MTILSLNSHMDPQLVMYILALTQAFKRLFKQAEVPTDYLWILATILGALLNAIPFYMSPFWIIVNAAVYGAITGFCTSMGVSLVDDRFSKIQPLKIEEANITDSKITTGDVSASELNAEK